PGLAPGDAAILTHRGRLDPSTPLGAMVGQDDACVDTDFNKLYSCLLDALATSADCGLICPTVCAVASTCFITPNPSCFLTIPGCIGCLIKCGVGIAKLAKCKRDASKACDSNPKPATSPVDPNEKLVIAKRFIQSEQLLVYPIHFENVGDVEALDVFVTDVLD